MDLWDLPGGGMQHGELPNEAAIREAKEETGIDIEIIRLLGVFALPAPRDNQVIFEFLGQAAGGRATMSDETGDVCFFALTDLPKNISPRKRSLIELAAKDSKDMVFLRSNLPHVTDWLAQQKDIS